MPLIFTQGIDYIWYLDILLLNLIKHFKTAFIHHHVGHGFPFGFSVHIRKRIELGHT